MKDKYLWRCQVLETDDVRGIPATCDAYKCKIQRYRLGGQILGVGRRSTGISRGMIYMDPEDDTQGLYLDELIIHNALHDVTGVVLVGKSLWDIVWWANYEPTNDQVIYRMLPSILKHNYKTIVRCIERSAWLSKYCDNSLTEKALENNLKLLDPVLFQPTTDTNIRYRSIAYKYGDCKGKVVITKWHKDMVLSSTACVFLNGSDKQVQVMAYHEYVYSNTPAGYIESPGTDYPIWWTSKKPTFAEVRKVLTE